MPWLIEFHGRQLLSDKSDLTGSIELLVDAQVNADAMNVQKARRKADEWRFL